jgi:hypothetical protein
MASLVWDYQSRSGLSSLVDSTRVVATSTTVPQDDRKPYLVEHDALIQSLLILEKIILEKSDLAGGAGADSPKTRSTKSVTFSIPEATSELESGAALVDIAAGAVLLRRDYLAMRALTLQNGTRTTAFLLESPADCNSVFNAIRIPGRRISRLRYIADVSDIFKSEGGDPHLRSLMGRAIAEARAHHLREWAEVFSDSDSEMTELHLEILAKVYELEISCYELNLEFREWIWTKTINPGAPNRVDLAQRSFGGSLTAAEGGGSPPLNHFDRLVITGRE